MHVLFISDVYFPRVNGVSTAIETYARELRALGDRVDLIAPEYGSARIDATVMRVASRRVPFDPEDRLMSRRGALRCGRRLDHAGVDLVHIQTPFVAHYAGIAIARRLGVPAVATYHTLFEEYLQHYVPLVPPAWLRGLARRWSRRQCDAMAAVIVPTLAVADTLTRYGVSAPITVLPTGIPVEQFSLGDRTAFRARLGVAPGQPLLLYVGRVAFEKNIDYLLRVLVRALPQRPDLVLAIAGDGPAREVLVRQARELGVAGAVRFVGYLDRGVALASCYAAADLFVFASRTETQGLVLLEAMAAGLPVVALAAMGTGEILAGGGAVVAPDDESRFADAVLALIGDARRRRLLAREAVRRAAAWSAPVLARRLRGFYDSVLSAQAGLSLAASSGATAAR